MPNSAGYARMSRCHYVLIAQTIKELPSTIRLRVALEFADSLRATNPRFQRERFLTACGVEGVA